MTIVRVMALSLFLVSFFLSHGSDTVGTKALPYLPGSVLYKSNYKLSLLPGDTLILLSYGKVTRFTADPHLGFISERSFSLYNDEINAKIISPIGYPYWITALQFACYKRKVSIVLSLLCCSSLKVNEQDKGGNTALHISCMKNHPTIIELLMNHSEIDCNIQNKQGNTPLHEACRLNSFLAAVSLLKNNDCSVNVLNHEQCTPLYYAQKSKNQYLTRLLIARGASGIGNPSSYVQMRDAAAIFCKKHKVGMHALDAVFFAYFFTLAWAVSYKIFPDLHN